MGACLDFLLLRSLRERLRWVDNVISPTDSELALSAILRRSKNRNARSEAAIPEL
jgi:hypothetical protein